MKRVTRDILAIDDDEDTIEGLLSEFDLLGYSIELAPTIRAAKHKLRTVDFKVLFVDLRMKLSEAGDVKDDAGLDLIRMLRKGKLGELNQQTPYVLISAQEFWIERLESKIETSELERMRSGRMTKFSKGDDLMPLIHKVADVLEAAKAQ
jgi:CheY-like chemotaxis protein